MRPSFTLVFVEDVIGRSGASRHVDVTRVADRSERQEAGHVSRVAGLSSMDKPADVATTGVVLCDLDGVVWIGHEPVPGSVEAVALLREAGLRVVFVTNASFRTTAEVVDDLARIGVPADGDVLTSAMAAALLVEPNESVMICGGKGLHDEVSRRGAHPIYAHECDPDAVDRAIRLLGAYARAIVGDGFSTLDLLASAARRGGAA